MNCIVINTILFDMDGTLTDVNQRWINPVHESLIHFKPNYDRSAIELNVPKLIEQAGHSSPMFVIKILWSIARIGGLSRIQTIQFILYMKAHRNAMKHIVLVDGVEEVLDEVSKSYKLALVTTASRDTANVALSTTIIGKYFKTVITRDDVSQVKPNPEGIFKALEELESYPENSVMIGDFPLDVRAGKLAGVKTIAVLGPMGQFTKPLIVNENPDLILEKIDDLLPNLGELPQIMD